MTNNYQVSFVVNVEAEDDKTAALEAYTKLIDATRHEARSIFHVKNAAGVSREASITAEEGDEYGHIMPPTGFRG